MNGTQERSFTRKALGLGPDEAHVWSVFLGFDDASIRAFEATLSSDERTRAGRFLAGRHARQFVARRGALRSILARYVGTEPDRLGFSLGPHGKPRLSMPAGTEGLRFSVSHSGERALIAVTEGRDIGVDVEKITVHELDEEVAQRFFSPREQAVLNSVPEAVRASVFFTFWTRKEACMKACGLGLSLPSRSFDVSFDSKESREITYCGDATIDRRSWTVIDIDGVPGSAAACAVEGNGMKVIRREFRLDRSCV